MPRTKKITLKRRSDGRYACRYKNLWFYGNTQEEALEARETYKINEKLGLEQKKDLNCYSYAAQWLTIYKSDITPHAFNAYAACVDLIFAPINDKRLSQVQPDDIALCFSSLSGYATDTINRAVTLMRGIFDSAVENGYMVRNPARSKALRLPKGTRKSHRSITPEERQLILTTEHAMRPAIMLMLYAGLRPGEAYAIDTRTDIDFNNNLIHVTKALGLYGKESTLTEGKTKNAIRDVPMLPILADALKDINGLVLASRRNPDQYINSGERAEYIRSYRYALEKNLNGREHKPKDKGWQKVTFSPYDMRHSFCTMCRDAGIDMKVLIEWMGHADAGMIMRIYDHVTDERRKIAFDILKKHLDS